MIINERGINSLEGFLLESNILTNNFLEKKTTDKNTIGKVLEEAKSSEGNLQPSNPLIGNSLISNPMRSNSLVSNLFNANSLGGNSLGLGGNSLGLGGNSSGLGGNLLGKLLESKPLAENSSGSSILGNDLFGTKRLDGNPLRGNNNILGNKQPGANPLVNILEGNSSVKSEGSLLSKITSNQGKNLNSSVNSLFGGNLLSGSAPAETEKKELVVTSDNSKNPIANQTPQEEKKPLFAGFSNLSGSNLSGSNSGSLLFMKPQNTDTKMSFFNNGGNKDQKVSNSLFNFPTTTPNNNPTLGINDSLLNNTSKSIINSKPEQKTEVNNKTSSSLFGLNFNNPNLTQTSGIFTSLSNDQKAESVDKKLSTGLLPTSSNVTNPLLSQNPILGKSLLSGSNTNSLFGNLGSNIGGDKSSGGFFSNLLPVTNQNSSNSLFGNLNNEKS